MSRVVNGGENWFRPILSLFLRPSAHPGGSEASGGTRLFRLPSLIHTVPFGPLESFGNILYSAFFFALLVSTPIHFLLAMWRSSPETYLGSLTETYMFSPVFGSKAVVMPGLRHLVGFLLVYPWIKSFGVASPGDRRILLSPSVHQRLPFMAIERFRRPSGECIRSMVSRVLAPAPLALLSRLYPWLRSQVRNSLISLSSFSQHSSLGQSISTSKTKAPARNLSHACWRCLESLPLRSRP